MLETLDFTIRIGSTPTFFYFDLYLYYVLFIFQLVFKSFPEKPEENTISRLSYTANGLVYFNWIKAQYTLVS